MDSSKLKQMSGKKSPAHRRVHAAAQKAISFQYCSQGSQPPSRGFVVGSSIVLVGVALLSPNTSAAEGIIYTLQGTASGTMVDNGAPVSFSDAPYSFSVLTDTSLLNTSGSNPPGGAFYYTPFVFGAGGGTISIDGVTGTWANGVGVYNYNYPSASPTIPPSTLAFTEQVGNGYFFFTFGSNPSLLDYTLNSAIGPLPLSNPSVNFPDAVTTSFGNFTLSNIDTETFTATTTVPEPETYALMVAGISLVEIAARRRNSTKQ